MTTDSSSAAASVVLHAEQLNVTSLRVPFERVVVRRRVITEVRTVEVRA